eukprot:696796-Pleurochrysis_carterae.AAC.1
MQLSSFCSVADRRGAGSSSLQSRWTWPQELGKQNRSMRVEVNSAQKTNCSPKMTNTGVYEPGRRGGRERTGVNERVSRER